MCINAKHILTIFIIFTQNVIMLMCCRQ